MGLPVVAGAGTATAGPAANPDDSTTAAMAPVAEILFMGVRRSTHPRLRAGALRPRPPTSNINSHISNLSHKGIFRHAKAETESSSASRNPCARR
ncbi:hypothetical protein NicSoilC5_19720 [Arthrobacter sp. NicSoilC5]|nr:hypothetical protein NicSoilC5_19720 [Arthrobacter sp. NicSoilC5]